MNPISLQRTNSDSKEHLQKEVHQDNRRSRIRQSTNNEIIYGNVVNINEASLICILSSHDEESSNLAKKYIVENYREGDLILCEGISYEDKLVDPSRTEGIPSQGHYNVRGWETPKTLEITMKANEIRALFQNHDSYARLNDLIDFSLNLSEYISKPEFQETFKIFLSKTQDYINAAKEKNKATQLVQSLEEIGTIAANLYEKSNCNISKEVIKNLLNELDLLIKNSEDNTTLNYITMYFVELFYNTLSIADLEGRDTFLAKLMKEHLTKFKVNALGQRLFVVAGDGHLRPLTNLYTPAPFEVLSNHPNTVVIMPRKLHVKEVELDPQKDIHPIEKCAVPSLEKGSGLQFCNL